jgi:hypothetical protein
MVDDVRTSGADPGVFDDDRLLAYALGLDDDPALVAAVAADDDLRSRLDALHAEVGNIGVQVHAFVPAPNDKYADLGDVRWAGLHDYIKAKPVRPPNAWRWLRVAVPVAATVLALAVGVTVVSRLNVGGSSSSSVGKSAGTLSGAAPSVRAAQTGENHGTRADAFALVVVARVGVVRDGIQSFSVVRTLKGKAPRVLRLRLLGKPARTGRLELLLLSPITTLGDQATGGGEKTTGGVTASRQPTPATSEPSPTPSTVPAPYLYRGRPAYGRELPSSTDPAKVQLP